MLSTSNQGSPSVRLTSRHPKQPKQDKLAKPKPARRRTVAESAVKSVKKIRALDFYPGSHITLPSNPYPSIHARSPETTRTAWVNPAFQTPDPKHMKSIGSITPALHRYQFPTSERPTTTTPTANPTAFPTLKMAYRQSMFPR